MSFTPSIVRTLTFVPFKSGALSDFTVHVSAPTFAYAVSSISVKSVSINPT